MKKWLVPLGACAPILLLVSVVYFLSVVPHGELFSIAAPLTFFSLFVLSLVVSAFLYLGDRESESGRAQSAVSIAITIGLLSALIIGGISGSSAIWSLKKSARERAALRIISVAEKDHYGSGSEVRLKNGEYHLSDNGPVYYYEKGPVSVVAFWDFRWILHGEETFYVSDPDADISKLPEELRESSTLVHKSGHWWVGSD